MLCTNCNRRIKKTLIKCPYCGEKVINKDRFAMPHLKEEDGSPKSLSHDTLTDKKYINDFLNEYDNSDEFDKVDDLDYDNLDDEIEKLIDKDLLIGETKQLCFFDEGTLVDDINLQISNMANQSTKKHHKDNKTKKNNITKKAKISEDTKKGKIISATPSQADNNNFQIESEVKLESDNNEKENKNDNQTQNKKKGQTNNRLPNVTNASSTTNSSKENKKSSTIKKKDSFIEVVPNHPKIQEKLKNKPVKTIEKEKTSDKTIEENDIVINDFISSKESVRKRRKIFIITAISLSLIIVAFLCAYQFYTNHDKKTSSEIIEKQDTIKEELNVLLENYYESSSVDELVKYLENIEIGRFNEALDYINDTCEKWVSTYHEKEMISLSELDEYNGKIKKLIANIYTYGIINRENGNIKIMTKEKYEELLEEIKKVYNDSSLYFEALELYKKKDYNKSYTALNSITKENRCYDKAKGLKEKIEKNIITSINKDIEKLTKNIDDLDDEAKLTKYIQIQEIIFEYKNVYYSVDLVHNTEYGLLLDEYSAYVEEYSEKVSKTK